MNKLRIIVIFLLALASTVSTKAQTQYVGGPTTTVVTPYVHTIGVGLQPPQDTLGSAPNGSLGVKNGILYLKLSTGNWQAIYAALSDIGRLPVIKFRTPCVGVSASGTTVTNYPATSVDSIAHYWGVANIGTDYGGVLWSGNTGGDSLGIAIPYGLIISNSIGEGHVSLHGRLHPAGAGTFTYNYPDSAGQISYELRSLTHTRWYNQGIGGQTLLQMRVRQWRDMLAGVAANTTDGRGSQTLTRLPYCVILEGGINDVYAGRTARQILDDLEFFAATAQANGIRLVVFNLPGDATATQAFLNVISVVNGYLAGGILDKYGATVWDFNSWWNDPAYGNDNIHHIATISDDIHPTKAGYIDLTPKMFNATKIPVLTGMVFQNEIGPGGFSGYGRPAGITIGGVAATIAKSTDTIPINWFLNDTTYVKTTSVTNVTGTTYYGFSSIYAILDNNPNNDVVFTRKTQPGAINPNIGASSLKIIAENNNNGVPIVQVFSNDQVYNQYKHVSNAAGGQFFFNGGNTPLAYNNATLNVTGQIGSSGGFYSTSVNNQLGTFQLGGSSSATGTGTGINFVSGGVLHQANNLAGNNGFSFEGFNPTPIITTSNLNIGTIYTRHGLSSITGARDTVSSFFANPTYNITTLANILNGDLLGGFLFQPKTYNTANKPIFGFRNDAGNNWFNTPYMSIGSQAGRTIIGGTVGAFGSGILDVVSTKQGMTVPRMTTAQRDSIGYVSSITVSNQGTGYTGTPPTLTFTGGTGSGAAGYLILNAGVLVAVLTQSGYQYKVGTGITVNVVGGNGTGAAVTGVVSGPDKGTIIYNTSVDSFQCYNGTVWLDVATSTTLHPLGAGGTPTSGSLGTNVTSITPTGTDRFLKLVLVTSGAVSGTLGVITYNSAWPNTPLAIIGYGDATTGAGVQGSIGGYIALSPTSTTQATLSGVITTAGTYTFYIHTGGN